MKDLQAEAKKRPDLHNQTKMHMLKDNARAERKDMRESAVTSLKEKKWLQGATLLAFVPVHAAKENISH